MRHQSTFSYEEEDRKETEQKLIEDDSEDYKRLARNAIENWDADSIIITTAVQFFESVYSNRRSKLRKLHNMADSILVFDEAHLMPKEYLQPCLQGIVYLTRYCNSEAIFLTATMPDFRQLMEKYALKGQRICNLIEDTSSFSVFRKCHYRFVGELSEEELIQRAKQFPSSLIIANSRKKVRDIYCLCTGKKFHLSTYMTPCDREVALENIRKELAQLELDFPDGENVPPERRITIVSTSLIEAGVDLDMYAVFRELDGLDSILQAGGRCNREGKRSGAEVFIFELPQNSRADQDGRRSITKGILQEYEDISMPECIRDYYGRLLGLNHEKLIQNTLSRQCSHIANIPFRSYAESFKVIDSKHQSLIVPRDDRCRELVWKLQTEGSRMETSRQLQRYACSIYQSELDDLIRQHVVQDYGTGIYCLTNPDYYDNEIGIIFEASDYFME